MNGEKDSCKFIVTSIIMIQAKSILIFFFALALLSSCKEFPPKDDDIPTQNLTILSVETTLNPSGYAPLTATIEISTLGLSKVSLLVRGKTEEGNLSHSFIDLDSVHSIPVLGLYPDFNNTVELTFLSEDDILLGTREYRIQTGPLIPDMPEIVINTANTSQMAQGWTFVSYFGYREGGDQLPQQPFIFDSNGEIRWYLELGSHPVLENLFYDNGMERLFNGNLYFGDVSTNTIYEMDMLGNILNSWNMPGFGFHHQVLEKPNGNFLLTVSKLDEATVEDYVIEIDRSTGTIVNTWNLNESLQYSRRTLTDNDTDWFQGNAIEYSRDDNSIIVSGRTQALVKVNNNNEVVWIMGNHSGWETSGSGEDLNNFLLKPLDANNQPITDPEVLNGTQNHPDFEWNWYQHAPQILPNGNIMLFDNGDNRNFSGTELYSRAVEYQIDEANMTIKQVWQYGKERGEETYSKIVSDIDYFPQENHVFFSPGAISLDGIAPYGKVIEVDYSTKEVLFEATITPPTPFFIITLHRTERMNIYPFSAVN